MVTHFTFALHEGRPVVLEARPKMPLIVHTFDSFQDAMEFYERQSGEPFDAQRRVKIQQKVESQGKGLAS